MPLGSWLYVAYPYKAPVVPTLHALRQITGVSCCIVSLMRHEWSPSFRLVVRDKWVKGPLLSRTPHISGKGSTFPGYVASWLCLEFVPWPLSR